ncbi:hypothetical protein F6V25_07485 [Oryzomonas japonica]|uniref:Major capsid protein n=1 Tax=Oryzomonas japonica TaxID=2603858 RepID=A0A7J4ZRI5_9BACT|nr:hypothetical protein [Oryzomonas japonica]KAB0665557.1 hypothetical protein F6V25_07485 [Oryzomonas japonica]
MAVIGNKGATLIDVANSLDPDGKVAAVAELLNQTNSILEDMPFKESNLETGHRSVIRTGLPSATWRKLYEGVQPSKSTRTPVVDTCGMLEARNHVDKDVAELNGNTAAFRLSEGVAEVEAMNQTMAQTLFYGDSSLNPERFNGLTPRYNTLSTAVPVSQNVISGGGTGSDNTSIWLVVWGENSVFGIYPKGSKAGLQHDDLGLQDVTDANGGFYRAYKDWWQWKNGLVVKDWRYAVRICNVDVSNLVTETSAADVIKLMIKAIHRIPFLTMGRPVFYANRTVREMLDIQALAKSSNVLAIREAAEQFKTTFMGIPIKTCDQLSLTETAVA